MSLQSLKEDLLQPKSSDRDLQFLRRNALSAREN